MKLIRSIAAASLLSVAAFSTILYTACKKNDCGNTTCQNGGTCTNNVCICPSGYTGSDCGTTWSTAFIGTYSCVTSCNPGTSFISYIVASATNGQDSVEIQNFGNYHTNVLAGVNNNNELFIPATNSGVSGQGNVNNGVVTIRYTILTGSGAGGQTCTMTMTKQ